MFLSVIRLHKAIALVSFCVAILALQAGAQSVSVLRPKIEQAISDITTQSGTFIQIDIATGESERGRFMISRPGKLRFEYDDQPIILLSDGRHVAQINTLTNSISRVRLNATPLRIILSENVNLSDGISITKMEQTPDSLFVTLYEVGKRNQGLITLFMDAVTFELKGWKIEEQGGLVTAVILQNIQTGVSIESELFRIPS